MIRGDPFEAMLKARNGLSDKNDDALELTNRTISAPNANNNNNNRNAPVSEQGFRYMVDLVTNKRENDQLSINCINSANMQEVRNSEDLFWALLMEKYLSVETETASSIAQKAEMLDGLSKLRDQSLFILMFVNTVIVMFYLAMYDQYNLVIDGDLNMGTIILSVFGVLVIVQFLAMLFHRVNMVLHVVSSSILYNRDREDKKKQLKFDAKRNLPRGMADIQVVNTGTKAQIMYNGEFMPANTEIVINGIRMNSSLDDYVSENEQTTHHNNMCFETVEAVEAEADFGEMNTCDGMDSYIEKFNVHTGDSSTTSTSSSSSSSVSDEEAIEISMNNASNIMNL